VIANVVVYFKKKRISALVETGVPASNIEAHVETFLLP
jgi:hypothetical protein